jgi:hypothetical protein
VGSSWFSTEQETKGSIVPGQLADLAVLSADYFSVAEDEIKSLESVLTIVGGKPVYATEEFAELAPPLPPVLPEWSPVAAFGGYAKPAGVPAYSPVVHARSHRHRCTDHALSGQKVCFTVPAAEFGRMGWVLQRLGSQAIVYPGQTQHARAAIQELSGQIRQERIFTHLGWRKRGGDWVYLHAAGALGTTGLRADWQVQLPGALRGYRFGVPTEGDARKRAIQASLELLQWRRAGLPFLYWPPCTGPP